ncbi:SPOR domain-containing protein [Chromobacterium sphagni]|uniref:SPOR domain-containing protein n=1 Tax=Chromobacterium sphagni TaxID=1903179 RepID=UPI001EFB454E|nr:SPOR domain-containing protein [Chromobacterium sphagni]
MDSRRPGRRRPGRHPIDGRADQAQGRNEQRRAESKLRQNHQTRRPAPRSRRHHPAQGGQRAGNAEQRPSGGTRRPRPGRAGCQQPSNTRPEQDSGGSQPAGRQPPCRQHAPTLLRPSQASPAGKGRAAKPPNRCRRQPTDRTCPQQRAGSHFATGGSRHRQRPPAKATAEATNKALPAGSSVGYQVQLGLFTSIGNAQKLVKDLQKHGIAAHTVTRVQLGPFKTRAEADEAMSKLRNLGYSPLLAASGQ